MKQKTIETTYKQKEESISTFLLTKLRNVAIYPFDNAAAPETISVSSVVIAA